MGAHIGHSALLQHADLIRIHDGVEPVGDDEDCLTPDHFGNGLVHLLLILRIHEGGGLVQHHDRGVFQDRPGQRDALPLPAGEHFAPVPGHGVDAILQPGKELPALGLLRRSQNLLIRGLRTAQADVLQQAHVEQELLLGHIGDLVVEGLHAHLPDVLAAHADAPAGHIIVVDQELCQGGLAAARLSHQGGKAPLRRGEGDAVEHLVLLIGKADILKGNGVILTREACLCLLQSRCAHQLLQRGDLVVDLGQGGHKPQRPQQGRTHAEGHAQHQGEVRQGGVSYQNQVRPDGQGEQGHTGQDAVVEGHPGPADLVPSQGEVPVAPHILLKALVGLPIPVEDLHHLHAVDVLHDGVVHLLGGGVVSTHLAGAGAVHGHHSHQTQRQSTQREQCQLPVHEEHGEKDEGRHRQIGQPLRQGMGQQQFDGVDVVNEHLLQGAHALLLDHAQGLPLQLSLEGSPQVFQGVVSRPVGEGQALYI